MTVIDDLLELGYTAALEDDEIVLKNAAGKVVIRLPQAALDLLPHDVLNRD